MPPRQSNKRKQPATPVPLQYEGAPEPRLGPCSLLPDKPKSSFSQGQDLVAMVVDVVEEAHGRFSLWGTTPEGASVLVRVADFQPYCYIAAPKKLVVAPDGSASEQDFPTESPEELRELKNVLNRWSPPEARIQLVEALQRKPIMFYRPDTPQGESFLKLTFAPGANVRKASASLAKALSAGRLRAFNLNWRDVEIYEGEVAPLQRFLADVPLSGGAWVCLPGDTPTQGGAARHGMQPASPLPAQQHSRAQHDLREQALEVGEPPGGYQLVSQHQRVSSCDIEVTAPWRGITCLSPDATQLADPAWTPFGPEQQALGGGGSGAGGAGEGERLSEVAQRGAERAKRGDIAPLRMLLMDVVSATADGADRVPAPAKDPIVAVACTVTTFHAAGHSGEGAGVRAPAVPAVPAVAEEDDAEEGGGDAEALQGPAATPSTLPSATLPPSRDHRPPQQVSVVFLLSCQQHSPTGASAAGRAGAPAPGPSTPQPPRGRAGARGGALGEGWSAGRGATDQEGAARMGSFPERLRERLSGAHVEVFEREDEMLLSFLHFFREADPDIVALFQVADTLDVVQQRLGVLGVEGGALRLSRMLPPHGKPMAIKKVTMYSAAWVRSQSRMSSTSNQETYRVEVDGRVVVDVLRQVLTNSNLASFSLVDCVQSLLGQTLEVLRPYQLSHLAGLVPPSEAAGQLSSFNGEPRTPPPPSASTRSPLGTKGSTAGKADAAELATPPGLADALRMARFALRRVGVVEALLHRLATIPETIEMARATGLTMGQVAYNAQMIRTWSLLLRTARRTGYVVAGRQETIPLSEHTFIMHPVEAGTVGLYKQPVAILDFASLYPSIYRAYNLCYTTLLHKDDQAAFLPDQLTTTPTGAVFVKPEVRAGILPSILAALIEARSATRAQLKEAADPAMRAVLDSRQKALKVTANALYGFTGAQASPLQCVPLADSCLAYGAQSCRTAIQALQEAEAQGRLGPHGGGARVIYGHTDSLFVLFPSATTAVEAIQAGKVASREVSRAFPPPMELKFERVCLPLMLLHVNRYAGRAYEREEEAQVEGDGGSLVVKGLKSMWRQAAPIVRTTLHGVLARIIMHNDVRGAVEFVEGEVRRLLTGRVDLYELIMTGGLWRVTGQQVEKAAAGEAGPAGPSGGGSTGTGGGGGAGGGAAPPEEEVRGPHAALAVRLSQRDPGRSFVLGERLQYVLLSGHKLQDEAAEDPLAAAKAGSPPDYDLYWRNKLQRPLQEIFATCLPPSQVQSLMAGPHTMVKVEQLAPHQHPSAAAGGAGPATPGARGGKGTPGKGRQMGLTAFYQQTAKCLGCRRNLAGYKGPLDRAPGLCQDCASTDSKWQSVYLALCEEQAQQEARLAAAAAACRQCDSAALAQELLCECGECPVLYARLGADSRLRGAQRALQRLDIF